MHADTLYHQMLDYEARVAEAKAAGTEPPPLKSLFNPKTESTPTPSEGDKVRPDGSVFVPGGLQIPEGMKTAKPLQDLTPHERELEVMALRQQAVQRDMYMAEVAPLVKADEEAKAKRRATFTNWFGETVGKWLA